MELSAYPSSHIHLPTSSFSDRPIRTPGKLRNRYLSIYSSAQIINSIIIYAINMYKTSSN